MQLNDVCLLDVIILTHTFELKPFWSFLYPLDGPNVSVIGIK